MVLVKGDGRWEQTDDDNNNSVSVWRQAAA